ncbi:MAG: hypothetical protein AAB489_02465, partial [Patescibacteria group bacterium]
MFRPSILTGLHEHRLLLDAEMPQPEDHVPKPELLQNVQSAETKELSKGREELKKAYESPTSFAERRVAGSIAKADEEIRDVEEDVEKIKKRSSELERHDMVADATKNILIPVGGILTLDAKTMPESVPASKQQAGIKAKTAEAKEIREEKVIAPESPDAQVKAGAQGARKETEEPATPPGSPEATVKEGEYPKIKKVMDDAMAVLRSDRADIGKKAEALATLLGGIFKLSLRMSSYVRGVDPDTNETVEKRDDKKPVELVKNPKKEIPQIDDELYGKRKKYKAAQEALTSMTEATPSETRAELERDTKELKKSISDLEKRQAELGKEQARREAEIPKECNADLVENITFGSGEKPNDWDDLTIVLKEGADIDAFTQKIKGQEGFTVNKEKRTITIDPPGGFWANAPGSGSEYNAKALFDAIKIVPAPGVQTIEATSNVENLQFASESANAVAPVKENITKTPVTPEQLQSLETTRKAAEARYQEKEAYMRPEERYFDEGERIARAEGLIHALDEEIKARDASGQSEEILAPLRALGRKTVYERNQAAVFATRKRMDEIISRQEKEIERIYKEKSSRNWFAHVSEALTGHTPYDTERQIAEQKLFSAMRVKEKILSEAVREITKPDVGSIDMNLVAEKMAQVEMNIRNLQKHVSTAEDWNLQQEMLTTTRDVGIIVLTMPLSFVGGGAAAGYSGAMKAGAFMGARMALADSAARNMENVQSGQKSVGQAVKDTVSDTGKGAVAGAVLGAAGKRMEPIVESGLSSAGKALSRLRAKPPTPPKTMPNVKSMTGEPPVMNPRANPKAE